jgi:hypothetical protein
MEKLRLQAAIAEAELAKAEMQAVRTETGGNGRLAPSPKVLLWRKLRARLEAMGEDVTNPKAALAVIDQPWAKTVLQHIEAEAYDDALKVLA